MKVLVMACHADDEILGCGGVICRHLEKGDQVHICIVTIPTDSQVFGWDKEFRLQKKKEQYAVDTDLHDSYNNRPIRHCLDHSVLELNKIGRAKLNYSIQKIINEVNPDIIYTHWVKDLNYMHQMVAFATIIAIRPPRKTALYMYEMESSRFSTKGFKPNYYVDITKYIQKKIDVFAEYDSEFRTDIHPRNQEGIRTQAQFRGHEVGLEYAEAFILVKDVIL
jgi:LmbE family N-acetylglucosaminyl deacetylase